MAQHWLTKFILAVFVSTACLTSAWASGVEQTHSTVPSQNASFVTDLQTFLKREDAQRYADLFAGAVVSGGVDATGGTLTHTPTALTAYPGGYYVTETGSVTYVSNSTCYLIVHTALTGNLGTFQRQSGTHYLTDCTSPSKPALPAASLWLATIVTNGSSVTAYTDLRTRVPYAGSYLLADLPSANTRGRLALVSDVNSGTLYWDSGAAWRQITLNPMTGAGDLIVGASGGAPTRLALGAANYVLGVDSTGAAHEYKSIIAGSGISVSHTVGGVTLAVVDATPPGAVIPYAGISAPSGWLLSDASAISCSTYPNLALVLVPSASVYGRGTAVGTFTVDTGTDIFTLASHGLFDGALIHVASTSTLPTGLSANTVYYVRDTTASTFRLAATSGGVAIDITGAGAGTHSLYDEVNLPDLRSRTVLGVGAGTFVANFVPADVDTGTEIITVPTNTTLYTGQAVVYTSSGTVVTGLVASTTYYVIRATATTIQLASSLSNALAGTAINLTGTGTGTHTLTQTLTTRTLGDRGGEEAHTQIESEVGRHRHPVTTDASATNANTAVMGSNGSGADADVSNAANYNTAPTTGANNMPPFLVLNYIIKTRGHAWTHRRPTFAQL